VTSRKARFKSITQLWPLLRDPRIPLWAKAAIPALAAAYVISPVDLIPDFLLGAGQLDDIGVMLLAASATAAFLQKFFASQQPEPARARASQSQSASHIYEANYRVK
jgi:uncharacterized membrane protein YkvA (DUF1232 family)